jgi:hypothetical protein
VLAEVGGGRDRRGPNCSAVKCIDNFHCGFNVLLRKRGCDECRKKMVRNALFGLLDVDRRRLRRQHSVERETLIGQKAGELGGVFGCLRHGFNGAALDFSQALQRCNVVGHLRLSFEKLAGGGNIEGGGGWVGQGNEALARVQDEGEGVLRLRGEVRKGSVASLQQNLDCCVRMKIVKAAEETMRSERQASDLDGILRIYALRTRVSSMRALTGDSAPARWSEQRCATTRCGASKRTDLKDVIASMNLDR